LFFVFILGFAVNPTVDETLFYNQRVVIWTCWRTV